MTEKPTLTLRPISDSTAAPAIQKKGRGWNIAESRLDTLHEAAREMRRNPSEAETALAEGLTAAELGKYKLKRTVVIGSAIVDFACQPLKVVVMLDRPGVDPVIAQRADRNLATVGIKVLRFAEADVLADRDAVVAAIVAALKARWHEQRARPNSRGPASNRDAGGRNGRGQGYS